MTIPSFEDQGQAACNIAPATAVVKLPSPADGLLVIDKLVVWRFHYKFVDEYAPSKKAEEEQVEVVYLY
jgi:hypothetical protein